MELQPTSRGIYPSCSTSIAITRFGVPIFSVKVISDNGNHSGKRLYKFLTVKVLNDLSCENGCSMKGF